MTWPASISARTTVFAGPTQGLRKLTDRLGFLPAQWSAVRITAITHAGALLWLCLWAAGDAAATSHALGLLLVTGLALCLALIVQRRAGGERAPATTRNEGPAAPIAFAALRSAQGISGGAGDGWSDLLQRVSHELRTPLNAVIGFSDVMHKELLGPLGHARYVEYADHIRQSGGDLLKATEDTLAITALLSRAQHIELTELEFASLMRDVRQAAVARFPARDVDVILSIDRDIDVVGDRRILRQALLNALCVVLRNAEQGCRVEIVARRAGDTVWLTIEAGTCGNSASDEGLEACLARALFAVCGQDLRLSTGANGGYIARVGLPAAVQRDLFTAVGGRADCVHLHA